MHGIKAAFLALVFLAVPIAAANQTVFTGTVEKVTGNQCATCKQVEVSVLLKTEAGSVDVRLGPRKFLTARHFLLESGDAITVTGYVTTEKDKDVVYANEVQKGGSRLVLRGKFGKPAWLERHGQTCESCGN